MHKPTPNSCHDVDATHWPPNITAADQEQTSLLVPNLNMEQNVAVYHFFGFLVYRRNWTQGMLEPGTSLPTPCLLQCTIRRKTQQAELPTSQKPPGPLPQQQQHQHGIIHHLQSNVHSSSPDSMKAHQHLMCRSLRGATCGIHTC